MDINIIRRIFTNISFKEEDGGGYFYLHFELNPIEVQYGLHSRYKIGFATPDSPNYMWPSPKRNLNNTGKMLLPNYADPSLPETVAEFVQRMKTVGDPATNTVRFNVPGIREPQIALEMTLFNPDYPYNLQEDYFPIMLTIDANGWGEW
ncbi:hypothetical protein GWD52_11805 [Enterobacteriaceae bacterium 4M9]|nr:hypothetical protein [Enterobacteriaceae bacterium 4M9]